MNPDFVDLLRAFIAADVRFLIVGAYARAGVTYQIGVPPGRIDILTELTGLSFADAWPDRVRRPFGDVEVDFIGRAAFIGTSARWAEPKIWATSKAWSEVGVTA